MRRRANVPRSRFLWNLGIFLIVGLGLGLWLWRPSLSFYHLEAGGRDMGKAEAFRAAYPTATNESLDLALRHFQRSVELTPADGYAHLRLGQAWLLTGNNEAAQQALGRAAALRPHDPTVHIELGYAWDGLGQAEKAVAEYEQGRYGPARDNAIIDYLKLVDWRIAAGSGDVALKTLQGKLLALDPNNLPALYRMATIYQGMGKEGAELAAPLRKRMQQFPAASVAVPSSPGLADYLAQTMIALTEDGTWTRDTLLNVASYQVWQFAKSASGPGTEQVLQTLVQHWPDDVDLRFDLAELYHRRGDPAQAEANYRRVLEKDPEHAEAVLRLRMANEERSKTATGPAAATVDSQGESEMADQIAVATALTVPVSQVGLGANLIPTAYAEDDSFPEGWRYSVYPPDVDGKNALFAHGNDDLVPGRKALRIDTLWRKPSEADQVSFAEYSSTSTVDPGKYLIVVRYSLTRVSQGAGLLQWVEYDILNGRALLSENLPPTHEGESTLRWIIDGPERRGQPTLLVRNSSDGFFTLTSASVRRITITQPVPSPENSGG